MSDSFAARVSGVMVGLNTLADGMMFVAHVFFAISQQQAVMMGLLSSSLLYRELPPPSSPL